jgi:uroporphyrinogen decarboxylase
MTSGKTDGMTGIERIGTALQLKEADRVPCAPLTCAAARRVYGVSYDKWSLKADLQTRSALEAYKLIGFDGYLTLVDLSVEAADLGQEVIYPCENTAHPNYDNPVVKTVEDYHKIPVVDPTKSPRMSEEIKYAKNLVDEIGSTCGIMAFVYGPLGILSMLRGGEKLFFDCLKNKEDVKAAVQIICDTLEPYVRACARTGAPAVVLDTLFASQTIMSKKLWCECEGQYCTRLADAIRDEGAVVVVHNCGEGIYFDVQIESMHPVAITFAYVPDDCADMVEAKEKWGSKLCMVGYVNPAVYCYLCTPEEVKEECKKEIEQLGKGGGFILCTGCEFPPNGSLLNAIAMMEASELYGKY